jgi:hypothetical protein
MFFETSSKTASNRHLVSIQLTLSHYGDDIDSGDSIASGDYIVSYENLVLFRA